ncbi:hypothetical protein PTI98_006573 [Pleurotus ostreatus]|nr:hypothetical protein PTI98_006573 [Pleurotus ostreatus]
MYSWTVSSVPFIDIDLVAATQVITARKIASGRCGQEHRYEKISTFIDGPAFVYQTTARTLGVDIKNGCYRLGYRLGFELRNLMEYETCDQRPRMPSNKVRFHMVAAMVCGSYVKQQETSVSRMAMKHDMAEAKVPVLVVHCHRVGTRCRPGSNCKLSSHKVEPATHNVAHKVTEADETFDWFI